MGAFFQSRAAVRDWALVLVTLAVCAALLVGFRGEPYAVGTTREVTVTVVPADRHSLWCRAAGDIEGFSCNSKGPERLAPYVTVNRELIILPGVFGFSEVHAEAERRQKLPPKEQRFSVVCQVRHLKFSTNHQVRFGTRGKFGPARAWIAATESCRPQ